MSVTKLASAKSCRIFQRSLDGVDIHRFVSSSGVRCAGTLEELELGNSELVFGSTADSDMILVLVDDVVFV